MVEESPREVPAWGRKDASFLAEGRRRDEGDLVPPTRSSDDWELRRLLLRGADDC